MFASVGHMFESCYCGRRPYVAWNWLCMNKDVTQVAIGNTRQWSHLQRRLSSSSTPDKLEDIPKLRFGHKCVMDASFKFVGRLPRTRERRPDDYVPHKCTPFSGQAV